jgi:hypothetical protein
MMMMFDYVESDGQPFVCFLDGGGEGDDKVSWVDLIGGI